MRRVSRSGLYPLLSILFFGAFLLHLWSSHNGSAKTGHTVPSVLQDGNSTNIEETGSEALGFETEIRNETLGFEKIFVVSLPARGDRLDAFVLSSSLTGFRAELSPGINGSEIPDSALPSTIGLHTDRNLRNAVVGTWRAHLNIARRIVQDRLSSALIMEDDSDWDVSLKDRMVDFGYGSRHFSMQTSGGQSCQAPYGDNWDMLWLGHCSIDESSSADFQNTSDYSADIQTMPQQRYLLENDASVPTPERRHNFATIPDLSSYSNTTRAIFRAKSGICLYAYALSYSGAQKMLRAQAARKTWAPIDIGLGDMCKDATDPFNCIGVFPQLIDSHKMAGSWDRDSNIGIFSHDEVREHAYTANIIHPLRLNLDKILRGEALFRQWAEDPEIVAEPGGVKHRIVDIEEGKSLNIMPEDAVFADHKPSTLTPPANDDYEDLADAEPPQVEDWGPP